MRRALHGYRERMKVAVSYDPADPRTAVLHPGRAGWDEAIVAAFFLGGAWLIWRFVLRVA